MKEQPRYNKTPEQGWTGMKSILDTAMPVEKSPRQVPIFWWAASAVVMAGLFGYIFFNGDIAEAPLVSSKEKILQEPFQRNDFQQEEQTKGESITTNQTKEKLEETIPTQYTEINGENELSTTNPVRNEVISSEKKAPGSKLKSKAKGTIVTPMASSDRSRADDLDMPVTDKLYSEGKADGERVALHHPIAVASIDDIQLTPALRNNQVLNPMSSLSASAITNERDRGFVMYPTSYVKAKRNPSFFNPTVAVSTLIGKQSGLGVYGGAGLDYNISRKFSLTTAIGYAAYMPNAHFLGSHLSKLSANEENTIINFDPAVGGLDSYVYAEEINVEADYSAINPLVETISQWQVDIGLNWRLSRRFYALSGVKFGFNTEAISQYPIVRNDPSGIPSSPYVELGNSLSSYDVIRKSSTSVFIGMGYRLGKHFDVFANWIHGFDQYVLNAENIYTADLSPGERTDYVRGLNVGLKYSL